jgi:arabinan endo-1,5-alpha-L-arabinosidase
VTRSRLNGGLTAVVVTAWMASIACTGGPEPAADSPARSEPTATPEAEPSPTSQPVVAASGAALDRDFPDPTVIRTSDGTFYGYATQFVTDARTVHIQAARSDDLESWAYLGDAMPERPAWAQSTQAYWAPHVVERDGTFYLFYSAIPDDADEEEMCLAVATSSSPGGPFEDVGQPLLCGIEIDVMVFRDPRSGNWFAYWGSSGDIAVQRMSDDLLNLEGSGPTIVLQGWSSPVRRPYEHGIEGPFVIYRRGWYYLLYSGDRCCEFPPRYAVLVARSRRPDGGFRRIGSVEGRRSSAILTDWERWAGPGHCSVVRDDSGRDWIVYHAIDRRKPYLPSGDVRRVMHVDRLTYRNGWPRLNVEPGT